MTKKTMTIEQALSVISEVINYCFEIRGYSNDDKTELAFREMVIEAENLIKDYLTKGLYNYE